MMEESIAVYIYRVIFGKLKCHKLFVKISADRLLDLKFYRKMTSNSTLAEVVMSSAGAPVWAPSQLLSHPIQIKHKTTLL